MVAKLAVRETRESGPILMVDLTAQRQRIAAGVEKGIAAILDHGQFILGPEVTALERKLEAFSGAKHCVTCANGTDALELILMAEGVGRGDAVFVPTFTFVATAEVVALTGAMPVFLDVDRESFNLASASLEDAIAVAKAKGLKPKAVITVDLFGQPVDYDAVGAIAEAHGLLVIADAAQSFGASRGGKKVGSLAPYTATSFYPSKPLGGYGDGGAIFAFDDAKAELLRVLRGHGKDEHGFSHVGRNSRLDSFQAAILLQKLTLLAEEIEMRNAVAQAYADALGDAVVTPRIAPGSQSAWAQYTIVSEKRDAIVSACRAANIHTAIHYTAPLHVQGAYRDYPVPAGGLPNAEWLSQRVVSLPMHPYLAPDAIDFIARTVVAA